MSVRDAEQAPTALVTGTSSGFGRGVAERLSSLGWQVLGTVRSDVDGLPFETVRCDVTHDADVARLGAEVQRRWGRLDALVNNAGAALAGPVEELSPDELRWQLDVNVVGPLSVLRACLPALRSAQGVVVQVSSESGIAGDGMFAAYNASKFGLEGAAEAVAQELAPLGVRVVIVEPGAFNTGIAHRARHAAGRGTAQVYDAGWEGLDAWAAWHVTGSADPGIVVDAIVAAVTRTGAPLRIPVGDGVAEKLRARAAELLAQADAADEFLTAR